MAGVPMANGHRPAGLMQLLHPALATAPRPDRDALQYDLDPALAAVVRLHADVDEHCATASTLGPEREGAGIVIDENGLILTVGYLIVEARDVTITILGRAEPVVGEAIAYDHETGLGMVRALDPLDIAPLALGSARGLAAGDPVVVSGYGGFEQAIAASVVARQEFAGPWEYMLDDAIFTTPLHPYWGGAALIGPDGALAGVGSLYLEEPLGEDGYSRPGNMFVPIDELLPVFDDMVSNGRVSRAPRPWVGLHVAEAEGRLYVTGVTSEGPGERAGFRGADAILSVEGVPVDNLPDMYRALWSAGEAGTEIRYTVLRDDDVITLRVTSGDRYAFLDLPQRH
ncbi:MAG: S1-C subfamily serine protease [Paracoccaceae bacterium]|jgi:S1-C subfamily serine protease